LSSIASVGVCCRVQDAGGYRIDALALPGGPSGETTVYILGDTK
jgi:hypothetical protein